MSPPRLKAALAIPSPGKRVGTKKRDMRWIDASGMVWASKLEADVYAWIRDSKVGEVRPCDKRDTIQYKTNVRSGVCEQCNHTKIYQRHTYTPDLYTSGVWPNKAGAVLIEVKGFLRPKDRRALRAIKVENETAHYALLLQRRHEPTVEWASKFLKGWSVGVWLKEGGIMVIQ